MWYDVGTVSVTNGSTTVTGAGTDFISGVQVGEGLYIGGDLYEIAVVNSSTELTLADSYLGSTATGQAYKIIPTQSLVADLSSGVADLISDFADVRDYAGNGKFNDGTQASPAITFTQDQNNGLYRIGSDNWGMSAGGQKQVDISTTDVELNYSGSKKLATTATGVDVTGTITADGLTVDGVARVDGDITIGRTTGSYVFTETEGGSERAGIHSSSLNDLVFKVNNQIPAIKIDGGTRDVSFYEDTGTTAKMVWDASAESLGIGTSIPTAALDVRGSAYFISTGGTRTTDTPNGNGVEVIGGATNNMLSYNRTSASYLPIRYRAGVQSWEVNNSEAMRIDSSGNLLVGTTNVNMHTASTGDGVVATSSGRLYAASTENIGASTTVGVFNRISSDGNLVQFKKDGSTVGSIRSRSGAVSTIILDPRTGGSGLTGTEGGIYPVNNEGDAADGLINLGLSNQRFKDLHLSGGVYLGGTGSANKLDDYETGTFTATVAPSGTGTLGLYSTEDKLAYAKVGNLVTITGRLFFNSKSSPVGGSIAISTLPFIVGNLSESSGFVGGSVVYRDGITTSWSNIPFYALEADNKIYIVKDASTINVDDRIHFSFSYMTA